MPSAIKSGKYKEERNIEKYIIISGGAINDVDPILLRRLAACARDHGKVIVFNGFIALFRGRMTQALSYHHFKKHKGNTAAVPGLSWHEFSGAGDSDSIWFNNLTDKDLKPYGLCKPVPGENWHVQLLESMSILFGLTKKIRQLNLYNGCHPGKPYVENSFAPVQCPDCKKMIDKNGNVIVK